MTLTNHPSIQPTIKPTNQLSIPNLGLRISERRIVLALVDILLVNSALATAVLLRADLIRSVSDVGANAKWFVSLTLVWLVVSTFFDCYDLARAADVDASIRSTGPAALVTVLIYTFIPSVTPPLISRGLIFYFALLAAGSILAWRAGYARLFAQPWFQQRALVVGAGSAGRALAAALQTAPTGSANPFRGTGYQLVGFIDDDAALCDTCIEGIPVLGGRGKLLEYAQTLQVSEIILAITHRHAIADELFDLLLHCREAGLRLVTMAAVYERLTGRVPIDHVGRDLHMIVPMTDNPGERLYQTLKRGVDILAGIIGLAATAVISPIVALANALTSPGPLFYKQKRVGKGGLVYDMWKFRSMRPNAEQATGAVWASEGDDRITPPGRWLRKTRLDELPQSINMLRGEMSLVGPRPERPEFVAELAQTIPFYRARHAVKPGLTGWAQIHYRYGSSEMDARIKLEYDLYYVKYANLALDLMIMLRTIPVMAQFKGQ